MLINLLLIKRTKCSVSKRHSINAIVERHKNKSLRAFQDDDTREWQACDVGSQSTLQVAGLTQTLDRRYVAKV